MEKTFIFPYDRSGLVLGFYHVPTTIFSQIGHVASLMDVTHLSRTVTSMVLWIDVTRLTFVCWRFSRPGGGFLALDPLVHVLHVFLERARHGEAGVAQLTLIGLLSRVGSVMRRKMAFLLERLT